MEATFGLEGLIVWGSGVEDLRGGRGLGFCGFRGSRV